MIKKALAVVAIVLMFSGCWPRKANDRQSILIKNHFIDDTSYMIVCKGYPREGLEGVQAMETAKEAALMNAQMVAKDFFIDSVDVVRQGTVDRYDTADGYAVVTYIIKGSDLKRSLRPERPPVE
ncbi:MAG: hypothetical protein MUC76_13505 [Spirochaetes bacterium]|nr:hypothetical protein [Spirochaetota bacterium]